MTSRRFFAGTTGPSSPINYSGNFLIGHSFAVEGGGNWFESYWMWCSSGQSTASPKCALWSMSFSPAPPAYVVPGSIVNAGAVTMVPGQWNQIPLATPIPISATYDANIPGNSGGYMAAFGVNGPFNDSQDSYWSANNPSNGPLHSFKEGSNLCAWGNNFGSGTFSTTASDPATSMPLGIDGTGNQFFTDVQINDTAPPGYAGTYRIWPNPNHGNQKVGLDDNTAYTISTEVKATLPVTGSKIWFMSPSGASSLPTAASVWDVSTQTKVLTNQSPTWSGPVGSGWISTPMPGNLPVGTYRVSVYNANAGNFSGGWNGKDANTAYWDLGVGHADIVSGPLTAVTNANSQSGVLWNGTHTGGAAASHVQPPFGMPPGESFPNQIALVSGGGDTNTIHTQNYFVDFEVTVNLPQVKKTLLLASGIV